jgi:hypothetical protein
MGNWAYELYSTFLPKQPSKRQYASSLLINGSHNTSFKNNNDDGLERLSSDSCVVSSWEAVKVFLLRQSGSYVVDRGFLAKINTCKMLHVERGPSRR